MTDESQFPEIERVSFATPEDAQKAKIWFEKIQSQVNALEEKRLGQLDIILRETEQVDDEEEAFLANDYGGTGWEREEIMVKIRNAVNSWKEIAKELRPPRKGKLNGN